MENDTETSQQSSNEDLQQQLFAAKHEVENLTQQLNCLVVLAQKAWQGDEAATIHLARVIGIDSSVDENSFTERNSTRRSSIKKSVKISESTDEIPWKRTPNISNSSSHENLAEQQEVSSSTTMSRNSYLHPFLKQTHIDPIQGQNSKKILNNMIRHHQNELRRGPIVANRNTPIAVRPRATKHLYRPASAEHVVRHLGTPISRNRPFFIFAGREFFQKTTTQTPLYQRAVLNSSNLSQAHNSDLLERSEVMGSSTVPDSTSTPAPTQTSKFLQQPSNSRLGARSVASDIPRRSSSALSNASSSKLSQMSERDRRDTMRLQRQLNLPKQGWIHQQA